MKESLTLDDFLNLFPCKIIENHLVTTRKRDFNPSEIKKRGEMFVEAVSRQEDELKNIPPEERDDEAEEALKELEEGKKNLLDALSKPIEFGEIDREMAKEDAETITQLCITTWFQILWLAVEEQNLIPLDSMLFPKKFPLSRGFTQEVIGEATTWLGWVAKDIGRYYTDDVSFIKKAFEVFVKKMKKKINDSPDEIFLYTNNKNLKICRVGDEYVLKVSE